MTTKPDLEMHLLRGVDAQGDSTKLPVRHAALLANKPLSDIETLDTNRTGFVTYDELLEAIAATRRKNQLTSACVIIVVVLLFVFVPFGSNVWANNSTRQLRTDETNTVGNQVHLVDKNGKNVAVGSAHLSSTFQPHANPSPQVRVDAVLLALVRPDLEQLTNLTNLSNFSGVIVGARRLAMEDLDFVVSDTPRRLASTGSSNNGNIAALLSRIPFAAAMKSLTAVSFHMPMGTMRYSDVLSACTHIGNGHHRFSLSYNIGATTKLGFVDVTKITGCASGQVTAGGFTLNGGTYTASCAAGQPCNVTRNYPSHVLQNTLSNMKLQGLWPPSAHELNVLDTKLARLYQPGGRRLASTGSYVGGALQGCGTGAAIGAAVGTPEGGIGAAPGAAIGCVVGAAAGAGGVAAGASSCFPAESKVLLPTGQSKPIEDIVVGDKVMAFDATVGKLVESAVYMNGHKNRFEMTDFFTIQTNGHKLSVSERHFVPLIRSEDLEGLCGALLKRDRSVVTGHSSIWKKCITSTYGKNVRVGDWLMISDSEENIFFENVLLVLLEMKRGKFNPYTMHGTIVVDGVVASVHSEWLFDEFVPKSMAKYLPIINQQVLAPVRLAYSYMPLCFQAADNKYDNGFDGVPTVHLLGELVQCLVKPVASFSGIYV